MTGAGVHEPMLAVESLSVTYGAVHAVRGVSLEVRSGEIVALLGANGAGRTPLLSALVGLVPPAAGRVTFEGADITGRPPEQIVRRGIALSPEGRRVFPRLTVADNLRIGAATDRDRVRVARSRKEVLDLFPLLRERSNQLAGTMSGGQQQMLAIGRALMSRPRLLLLDEPSLGLAPIVVDQIFELLVRLREQGTTVLIVEQNALRTLELADRAYVLATGGVELSGRAEDLRSSAEVREAYLGAVA